MNGDDLLSYNPMLLRILSHLGYRDIQRCQRVNRRIHDVIEENKRDLAVRPLAQLHMQTLNKLKHRGKTDVAIVVIRFWALNSDCELLITESSVIVQSNGFLPITEYLERNYNRIRYKWRKSKGDDQVWRYLIQENTHYDFDICQRIRARFKLFHYPEYRTKSLFDGLCAFLSLVASAFEFERVTFNNHEFSQWHTAPYQTTLFTDDQWGAIWDILLNTTSCRNLSIYSWFPTLPNFYTEWGCKCVELKANTNVSIFLPNLHVDDMFIQIYIDQLQFFDSLEPVTSLLKDWQSGQFTLRSIDFDLPMGLELPFTFADVLKAFRDLNCFSITEQTQDHHHFPCMVFFIRRTIDNKTIGIKYHYEALYIRECLSKEDEEPQLNDFYSVDSRYDWCPRTRRYLVKPETEEKNYL